VYQRSRPRVAWCAAFVLLSFALAPAGVRADTAAPAGTPTPAANAAPGVQNPGAGLSAAQLAAIAKESQNPVGNIAVLPFQNNWNYSYGPNLRTQYNLNMQPVIPISLGDKANLIERAIVPFVNQPSSLPYGSCPPQFNSASDCGSQFGIGSIQLQNYYAPKTKPNALIYGAGPIFQFPTVTAGFGTNQFGAGLTAVGLVMPGPWVIGDLANNVWRVAGPSAPPPQTLNTFTDQPFINFNFGRGWTLSEAPVMTCNWNAPGNQKWTVPVGLALIQTNNWFRQPMSFQLAYYGNVVRPNNAAYGQWRFQWSLLWPILRGRGAR